MKKTLTYNLLLECIYFTELDCCDSAFLEADMALPPALQRCLNIPVTGGIFPGLDQAQAGPSCFSFTR